MIERANVKYHVFTLTVNLLMTIVYPRHKPENVIHHTRSHQRRQLSK